MNYTEKNKNGFTLVELLVAMGVASVVVALFATSYLFQVRAKNTQEIITDMNQSARAALEIMVDEISLAGLNPTGTANSRIILANRGEIIFSMDKGDGASNLSDGDCCDANEVVRYHLTRDTNNDGVNDDLTKSCDLGREARPGLDATLTCAGGTAGLLTLAPNVDALNFVYLAPDGTIGARNGEPDVLPTPVSAANLANIRAVEVTIVARAGTVSRGFIYDYTNNEAYFNLEDARILPLVGNLNDHFRRERLATTVVCRNLGN